MNTNSIGIINEYSIYVPSNYLSYTYAYNITSDYIDLFEESILNPNESYNYIRVFFDNPRFN